MTKHYIQVAFLYCYPARLSQLPGPFELYWLVNLCNLGSNRDKLFLLANELSILPALLIRS